MGSKTQAISVAHPSTGAVSGKALVRWTCKLHQLRWPESVPFHSKE